MGTPPAPLPGQADPDAFRVGQLAESLGRSYYAHTAAVRVARHPLAATLLPAVEPGHIVPVGRVKQKDGTEQSFHFEHFLGAAQAEDRDEFDRVFLGGSLLALGDALHGHDYFDHAPELELVYHLRNGVAHGNHFNITASGVARLSKWPAHNRLAWVRSQSVTFEVTTGLNGQEVLWAYLEPGDVVALFQAVGLYLVRRGNGDPSGHDSTRGLHLRRRIADREGSGRRQAGLAAPGPRGGTPRAAAPGVHAGHAPISHWHLRPDVGVAGTGADDASRRDRFCLYRSRE